VFVDVGALCPKLKTETIPQNLFGHVSWQLLFNTTVLFKTTVVLRPCSTRAVERLVVRPRDGKLRDQTSIAEAFSHVLAWLAILGS
jgi:hypothetical protein